MEQPQIRAAFRLRQGLGRRLPTRTQYSPSLLYNYVLQHTLCAQTTLRRGACPYS